MSLFQAVQKQQDPLSWPRSRKRLSPSRGGREDARGDCASEDDLPVLTTPQIQKPHGAGVLQKGVDYTQLQRTHTAKGLASTPRTVAPSDIYASCLEKRRLFTISGEKLHPGSTLYRLFPAKEGRRPTNQMEPYPPKRATTIERAIRHRESLHIPKGKRNFIQKNAYFLRGGRAHWKRALKGGKKFLFEPSLHIEGFS